jgi:hypothetical protein
MLAADTLVWKSGFEEGFPGGLWLQDGGGSWSPDGTMPTGRASAWTLVSRESGEPVFSGDHSYRGWIEGSAPESHSACPGINTEIRTPLVNSFMVYLDADYNSMSASEWIHLGSWGNSEEATLHTLSVRDRKLRLAHTAPSEGEYIGSRPQADFPLRKWVRITVYVHYDGSEGYVHVWQDGVSVLRGNVGRLETSPGTKLERVHWGMSASAETESGALYNDDILIWTLSAPLSSFDQEPRWQDSPQNKDTAPPAPPVNLRIVADS